MTPAGVEPGGVIEIACSANTPYVPHVTAMLHSLLTHTTARPVRVWMLHGPDLHEDARPNLTKVIEDLGAQIEYLRVPDELMAGFPTAKFHYSCWYRILLPELLPEVDRILYLDCDIIVTDDLEPLWSTDLGERSFAACINPLYRPMYKSVRRMGITDHRDYLNSGVLLLDLARLRQEGLAGQLRAYAALHPDNTCPEQDALSVLKRGEWLSLHPRWNLQTALLDRPRRKLPFTSAQVSEAIERPAVVHFNGPFKPWQYHCRHPMRHLYAAHLSATPWPAEPLENDSWAYRLMRPLSVGGQYRVLLYVRPAWMAMRRRLRALTAS
jgi:lipopolysaccharide biosynthesis glycosyltransferase